MSLTTDGLDVRLDSASTPASGASDAERQKVRHLAEQFEAMLMTQMLRDMRRSMLGDDEEREKDGFGADALTDTIDVELGLALSRAGGLGLSSFLLDAFERLAGVAVPAGDATRTIPVLPPALNAVPAVPSAFTPPADGRSSLPPPASPPVEPPTGVPPALAEPALNIQAGRISSAYGWRNDPLTGTSRFHEGVDIAMPVGRHVVAADRGRVVFSGTQAGFGNTIVIEHAPGTQTRYAHLSEQTVHAGDEVSAGQLIGRSGATGRVTGPHLHFEVLVDGKPVNPLRQGAD